MDRYPLLTLWAADGLTAAALVVLAGGLAYLAARRRDLPFSTLLAMIAGLFVVAAAGHAAAAWHQGDGGGGYRWLLAAAAWFGAVALFRILPAALRLPRDDDVRRARDELESHVQARTAELLESNQRLNTEVHQRERAEAEIRRLNASLENRLTELQTLFEFIPIGVGIAKDVDCTHIQMNPALAIILNLPPAHACLAPAPYQNPGAYRLLRRGTELPPHQHPMRLAAAENQAVLDFEMTIARSDGIELDVLVSAVPLRDRTGHARGCVATFQDITQRKRGEQDRLDFERRLQETQKLESLGVLAGGIAHDFNNLLTGVLGHANLARFSLVQGQEPVEQALDQIERSAQRAADLCKQLLAYAGKGRFDVHPLDLSRLVEEMSHLLSVSITHRASLELQLAADLPAVMGDVTQLRQVVMNLVINAAESVPSEKAAGRIRLLTRTVQAAPELFQGFGGGEPFVGEAVELQVIDNGSGMNTDTLARIFDPFFTTKFTGRGLGLAAVLGIVRSHQGAIRVVSEPGRGTMFRLLFPAATGAVAAPAAPTQTLTPWRGEGAALVIDDEESVRAVAQRTLEKLGFTVVLARDGQEGLEKFRQGGPFALVLLDLTMPRLNGEQTFRLLHAEQPDLPVLLMSGFNEQVTTERFGGHRLAGFVPKPFTVELLARRVREALARAPAASPPSQS